MPRVEEVGKGEEGRRHGAALGCLDYGGLGNTGVQTVCTGNCTGYFFFCFFSFVALLVSFLLAGWLQGN